MSNIKINCRVTTHMILNFCMDVYRIDVMVCIECFAACIEFIYLIYDNVLNVFSPLELFPQIDPLGKMNYDNNDYG